jgi:hypothetical protein
MRARTALERQTTEVRYVYECASSSSATFARAVERRTISVIEQIPS